MSRPHFSSPGCRGFWGLMLVALVGCGGGTSDPLNRQDISGQVTLQGQPLDTGTISFEPQAGTGGTSGGATIENGKFALPKGRGLAPGTYTVRLSSPEGGPVVTDEAPGETPPPAKERIPASWNSQSEQTISVEAGKQNTFEFEVP